MDSRYQRNIYQIVHKYHQTIHKLTNLQIEQLEEHIAEKNTDLICSGGWPAWRWVARRGWLRKLA
jgi:hypothetical protein